MPCEVEALEAFEQRVPQVVLYIDAVAPAGVSADVLEDEVHRRETDEQTSNGPIGSVWVVIVLSTIARCTSGRIEVMTWPRIATPKAISTPFLWRTRKGHSFRSQPGSVGFFIVDDGSQITRVSRSVGWSRPVALRGKRARKLTERVL